MSVEAVVFDLDGVLLDSEQAWDDARQDLVREHGGTWTPGPAGPTTLSWDAEEEEGLPGSWVFTFEFASRTVGTFTSGPREGTGQAPGIFLLKE